MANKLVNSCNRGGELKTKLTKTFKSVKYLILKGKISEQDRSSYLQKIIAGIMVLFKKDTDRFINKLNKTHEIRLIVSGDYVETINLNLIKAGIVALDYETMNPEHIREDVSDLVFTFVNTLLTDSYAANVNVYVTELINMYLQLTTANHDKEPSTQCDGKLNVY